MINTPASIPERFRKAILHKTGVLNDAVTRRPGRAKSLAIPFLLLILFWAGCFEKPLSPVAPQWDVNVSVPLINRTYTVSELLDRDSSLLHQDGTGLLVYSNSQQFSAISVGEKLKVAPASENYQSNIGRFSIKPPSPQSQQITVGEMNPSLGSQQGSSISVPPFSFSLTGRTFPAISEFQQVSLVSGQATLTLINRLTIPIDNLSLTVRSQLGDLYQFNYAPMIQPSDSVKQIFSLANRTVGNTFSFDFSGRYPGSEGLVQVDTSLTVLIRLDFSSDIQASQAVARVPGNTFSSAGSFLIDDSTRIESAKVKSGTLFITLNNALALSGQTSISIPNLRQPSGSPFTRVIGFFAQQQSVRAEIPLDGYIVESPDGKLNYSITTETYDTGNNFITLDSSMTISGSVSTSEISFQYLQGRIKPTSVDVDITRTIDLGEINRVFSGTTTFSQARIYLTITTSGRYPFDLDAIVRARSSKTGQIATLAIPTDQRRVSFPKTMISITETNSNIVSFFNSFSSHLPDEFTVSGKALLNPGFGSGSVAVSDTIGVLLSVEIPLKIGILNGTARDTTELTISSETQREIDRSNYGRVSFEVENGLPVAIQLSLELLDGQKGKLMILPKSSQPPLAVKGAQVDAQGRAILPASSTTYVELVSEDIRKFQTAKYTAFMMTIGTSGGGTLPVQLRATDYVRVRAYSTLNYRVNSK